LPPRADECVRDVDHDEPDGQGIVDAEELLHPRDEERARDLVERLHTLRGRLDAAAEDYASGLIDRGQLVRVTGRLRPEVEAAETELAAGRRGSALDGVATGRTAAAALSRLSLERRRAVIDALMVVRILPATSYSRGHHPERVHVDWRTT
jgi:site-specific DNA recombinase